MIISSQTPTRMRRHQEPKQTNLWSTSGRRHFRIPKQHVLQQTSVLSIVIIPVLLEYQLARTPEQCPRTVYELALVIIVLTRDINIMFLTKSNIYYHAADYGFLPLSVLSVNYLKVYYVNVKNCNYIQKQSMHEACIALFDIRTHLKIPAKTICVRDHGITLWRQLMLFPDSHINTECSWRHVGFEDAVCVNIWTPHTEHMTGFTHNRYIGRGIYVTFSNCSKYNVNVRYIAVYVNILLIAVGSPMRYAYITTDGYQQWDIVSIACFSAHSSIQ